MIAHDYVHIPIGISLCVIVGSVVVGVITSLMATRPKGEAHGG
jgi:hypothetical protein